MKIKRFRARNFSEALDLVKKELSDDAVILSSEEKKGIRPYVEVTAAVDYESLSREQHLKSIHGNSERIARTRISPDPSPPANSSDCLSHEEIKREIGRLREEIEGMKSSGFEISLPVKKRMIFHFLRERKVRDEFALRLCQKARDLDDIPSLIAADVRVKDSTVAKKAMMLIGPSGVGKTTTIAKLSANAVREGKRTAIITLDTYRIGALEQIRVYSRIMGIPLSIVSDVGAFRTGLADFMKQRDIIFIDTTGRNPRDEGYINDIARFCDSELPIELHLLVSAHCDDEFMIETYRFYRRLPVEFLTFTKLDEAVRFGSLYNILLTYQKPVAYITTGQRVPDDIESSTVKRLTDLILAKGCTSC
jgi:flagellar biosynthesis protein FlhF